MAEDDKPILAICSQCKKEKLCFVMEEVTRCDNIINHFCSVECFSDFMEKEDGS